MKNLMGIFVIIIFTTASLSFISYTNINNEKNNRFSPQIYEENNDELMSCGTNVISDGFIVRRGFIDDTNPILINEGSVKSEQLDLPEYFNWRDYGGYDWTTPIKDQYFPEGCGSCWAFGALGALECSINIQEGIPDLNPDLSEQYLLSCFSSGGCIGGEPRGAFSYILRNDSHGNYCNGIIPEGCFPYLANDTISCDMKCDDWQNYLIPIVSFGETQGNQVRNTVKANIMEYGPVAATMMYPMNLSLFLSTNHDPDAYYPFVESESYQAGHCVTIIGWKDDSSIAKGGYWIVKNSEGVDMGYEGYFNIEYEATYIAYWTYWVDYDPESYDWHPTPKANGPYFGIINDPVQFHGETSGEHPPFTFLWDFGDESVSMEQNPTHVYTNMGKYPVILTVTDKDGNFFSDESYVWIQESNLPPEAPIIEDVPEKIAPGNWKDIFYYNATFYDPDTPIIYYQYDICGYDKGVWSDPIFSSEKERMVGWEIPKEKGTYNIRWKLMDPYGAESEWSEAIIKVSNSKSFENLWFTHLLRLFLEENLIFQF